MIFILDKNILHTELLYSFIGIHASIQQIPLRLVKSHCSAMTKRRSMHICLLFKHKSCPHLCSASLNSCQYNPLHHVNSMPFFLTAALINQSVQYLRAHQLASTKCSVLAYSWPQLLPIVTCKIYTWWLLSFGKHVQEQLLITKLNLKLSLKSS